MCSSWNPRYCYVETPVQLWNFSTLSKIHIFKERSCQTHLRYDICSKMLFEKINEPSMSCVCKEEKVLQEFLCSSTVHSMTNTLCLTNYYPCFYVSRRVPFSRFLADMAEILNRPYTFQKLFSENKTLMKQYPCS